MPRIRENVLGVPIDALNFQQVIKTIEKYILSERTYQIATVNPEFIIAAQKNKKFREVLNQTSLNTADGTGILWAMNYLHGIKMRERVTGVDLFWALCKLSEEKGYRIFMLGGQPGVAKEAAKRIKLIHPLTRIVYTYPGSPKETKKIRGLIRKTRPQIIFVAWGAPKQEIWIYRNLNKFKTPLVAVGVGGAFDFIAGKQTRAPKWVQKAGLEWFYRLIKEPKRIGRIWTAVVKFPLAVFISKLKE